MWTRRAWREGGHGFSGWLRKTMIAEGVLFQPIGREVDEYSGLGNESGPGLFDGGLGPCDGHVPGFGGRLCARSRFGPDVVDGELGPDGERETDCECQEANDGGTNGKQPFLFSAHFATAVEVRHAELGHPPTAPVDWISGHDEGPAGKCYRQDGGNSNGAE